MVVLVSSELKSLNKEVYGIFQPIGIHASHGEIVELGNAANDRILLSLQGALSRHKQMEYWVLVCCYG